MPDINQFIKEVERLNPEILGDHGFDRSKHFGEFFADFDYMGVQPTLTACEGFLAFCDSCRANGLKLHKCNLEDEKRAYLAIKNCRYVTTNYGWQR